ncbi:o-phosphoseryl-trna selenium transferase [Plasmopara halstedii]|uniref:O-phosphoseryl-tRNA(Sec) selenium transferase n=1 Tax=Plasmopara halstedii TaxID=4781 RepID=A0A0P1A4N1_PLAHL|nr:o-phosphoseryl-trna selenium transferase [Plasmopara halstedii]CEG35418.1 o-phosphoseryl-trna selenium transferase [Plasmopara halstedii]|eukprot:XP_024571787.1 o-phosphoseryl-trna selenium transferase [Plasmopara halstedii]
MLLAQRLLPDEGWDDASVELLLHTLSSMDSNNFRGRAGTGEREGRVFSSLVARRHYYLAHGVDRSGDVAAVQPKAAGSSLMVQLANALAKDVLPLAGMRAVQAALILPVATGMSLTLSDLEAGLIPLVLANVLVGFEDTGSGGYLNTDLAGMAAMMDGSIHMTKLVAVGVAHVINNAYGVQASKCVHEIELAMRSGRVDAVVQILDKTSWCPSTPTLDFFITILQMGNRRLLNERKQVAGYMRMKLNAVAMEEGERVLHVLSNEISFAMTLTTLCPNVTNMQEVSRQLTSLRFMLFL